MTPVEHPISVDPLLELLVGLVMLTAVILAHGAGVRAVYRGFTRAWETHGAFRPMWRYNLIMAAAVAALAALHLAASMMWAWPMWYFGLLQSLRDSYFFAVECYTTLGEGNVSLPYAWRLIGPVIAISGLFNFGLTASVFVNMFSEVGKLDKARLHKER